MNTIKHNKVVYITYAILNNQQAVVEQHDVPVAYLHGGSGGLLPGIEAALEGHGIGERVELLLAPEEAYGVRDESQQELYALADAVTFQCGFNAR